MWQADGLDIDIPDKETGLPNIRISNNQNFELRAKAAAQGASRVRSIVSAAIKLEMREVAPSSRNAPAERVQSGGARVSTTDSKVGKKRI